MSNQITFFRRIMNFFSSYIERTAHERTRRYLLGLNDRVLDDMGFSRELLEQGPKAWPWRLPEETYGQPRSALAMRALRGDSAAHDHGRPAITPAAQISPAVVEAKKAA